MIKVEKLLDNASGYVIKERVKVPLLPGLLLTEKEYLTVVVESGNIVFSIHESEIVTRSAVAETHKTPAKATIPTDSAPAKPLKIIQPKKRG